MKKILILMLLMFSLSVTFLSSIKASNLPLIGKKIVIDAGHGGKDPGTTFGSIYEKDINLKISLKLKEELEKNGATIIMIRVGDYDLSSPNAYQRKKSDFDNRLKIINESGSDLYLSIHLNYLDDSRYFGAQVFYNKDNKDFAQSLSTVLNKELKSTREIKKIPEDTYMYKYIKIKGALVECGFLSNSSERSKLITDEYQKTLAKALTKGVIEYYS